MAKIYGLNGVLRGRQGNNVFAVQNGTQVVKAYQPVVSNPRTQSQQTNRVAFALGGKISSFTPSLAVAGMRGATVRDRRGSFVASIKRNAAVSLSETGYVASIPFASILFSQGAVPIWSQPVTVTAVMATTGVITVSVPGFSGLANRPAGYDELVIAGMFDNAGSPLDAIQCKIRSHSGADTFRFKKNDVTSTAMIAVYVAPFVPTQSSAGLRSSNVGADAATSSAVLNASVQSFASSNNWGNSELIGLVEAAVPNLNSAAIDDGERVSSRRIK